ncbi:electron transfer flavoprotein subunit beta/FixA family protein [Aquirufa aurantiipilula]|uniref:electron transfer flavoprotein subunit beta/FixA family protein n=1 Tax=Aquirufa aurantiipilula TaxID=2696561 RepID=UPI001CAA42FF|nr:electron transfer flavoprotein subunit beta/FixA family protein [Aquirufa aurantiipilula]MBZ1325465.1 electron transfer flavoprotein subunit beta/FixA family protein [Aquirufa aurantiipilula]
MKILVCISVVPDTTSKITLDSSNTRINSEGLTFIVGPYDDYALSRAIEIKEQTQAELVVLHVGTADSEALIRKCLALGADSAVRIDTVAVDSYQVAQEIIQYAYDKSFDLIMMGKEAIDYNSGIVHALVAHGLGFNHFSPVMHADYDGGKLILEIETDLGKSKVSSTLPAVLGCQEPIAEWKIPSMRGIMTARTKEIAVIAPSKEKFESQITAHVVETERLQKMIPVENAESLIDILKSENLI